MEATTTKTRPDRTFNLSEVLDQKVVLRGEKVGKLKDMTITEVGKLPEVTALVVKRAFGNPALLIPWNHVRSFGEDEVVIDIDDIKGFQSEPSEQAVLLRDHILDKKILDLEDTEVEIVYDLKLVIKNDRMYVSAVDSSRFGRLRRLGFRRRADQGQARETRKEDIIPWTYVQTLPPNMTSFKGDVKLRILRENLSDMQPADVADILEELDHDQRVLVFNQLESEHASDTLEEIDPNVQRELVASLSEDKVAKLIDLMTPGQASDLIGALPHDKTEEILPRINEDLAAKVRSIMEKQEERAINYATSDFIKISPDRTSEEVRDHYARLARGKHVVMYLYIVGQEDKLLGVLDIKELLEAPDDALLSDVMVENVITLSPESTLKDASKIFSRYDFRAVPVTDQEARIVGVVPYRDVMKLTHHLVE